MEDPVGRLSCRTLRCVLVSSVATTWLVGMTPASAQANGQAGAPADQTAAAAGQTVPAAGQPAPAAQVTPDQPDQAGAPKVADVVVTARRTEENLQKVPVAVTVLTGDALRERSINTPTDLVFASPSLQITTAFGRLNGSFQIRGLASGTQTYFAEIPGGPTQAAAPLYDIANVQVLNGPQGTLFGRTNTAGAVVITPTRPQLGKLGGFVQDEAGNLNTNRLRAALNVPIVDGHLAVRLAVERTHVDGYTRILNSAQRVNEENNEGARLSVLWKPGRGWFSNYAMVDYFHVDEASSGFVLAAANPNLPILNLPVSLSAPGGAAAGAANFGTVCATAVGAGLSPSLAACEDQRLRIAATFKPAILAELARVQAGGNDARRYAVGMTGYTPDERLHQFTVVDQADIDFGRAGPTTIGLRNIFGFQAARGVSIWPSDGVGGILQDGVAINGAASIYANTPSAQQYGNHITYKEGPFQHIYSEEAQLHGVVSDNLLTWTVGGFYQNTPQVVNLTGIRNASIGLSGITLPTLGWNPSFPFPDGGQTTQKAVYGQATADLSRLTPFIEGLHFTAGVRQSWDRSELRTIAVRTDLTTGNYVPNGPVITSLTKSSGTNYTFALDAQVTRDLLLYGTKRRGYRPGGLNQVTNAQLVPGFQPEYGPELVNDFEIGAKSQFSQGGVSGRLNVDFYQENYTNIQTNLSVFNGGNTTNFTVNAAAARIRGVEAIGTILFGNWSFDGTASVSSARFTRWVASDPLSVIKPGDPRCLPGSTTLCLIDLSGNPFPNLPRFQGTLTARYTLPLDAAVGRISLAGTAAYTGRKYFTNNAQRQVQEFGPAARDAVSQPGFTRFDMRLDWTNIRKSRFSAAAFVNNLADKSYAISDLAQLTTLGIVANLYAAPRTFGLQLRYEY